MSQRETSEASEEPMIARSNGDVPKQRSCMSCGKPFDSDGWHNRLCNTCQKRSVA